MNQRIVLHDDPAQSPVSLLQIRVQVPWVAPMVLCTVTTTAADVVLFAAASFATAVRLWLPFEEPAVLQAME